MSLLLQSQLEAERWKSGSVKRPGGPAGVTVRPSPPQPPPPATVATVALVVTTTPASTPDNDKNDDKSADADGGDIESAFEDCATESQTMPSKSPLATQETPESKRAKAQGVEDCHRNPSRSLSPA